MLDEINNKKIVSNILKKNSSNSLGQSPKINCDSDKQEFCNIENSSSKKQKDKKKSTENKDSLGRKLYNFKNNYQVDLLKHSDANINILKSQDKIKSPSIKSKIELKNSLNEETFKLSPLLNFKDSIDKLVKKNSMDERENRSPVISCKDEFFSKKNPMKINTLNKKTIINYFGHKNEKLYKKDKVKEEFKEKKENNKEIKEFYETTEEFMKKIPKLKPPTTEDLEKLSVEVVNPLKKKIVVFDLDETLVHCEAKTPNKCEKILKVGSPSSEMAKIGINIRPYLLESLLEIKKYFLIIIFTASQQNLGDVILDYLDPEKEIFYMRLYRNHCYQTKLNNDTIYIKDLRILRNVDLKDVVIVDNSVLSFSFLLDNGIPILPYYNNKNDTELIILVNYLKHLATFEDMRIENRKNIKLDVLYKQANNEILSVEESHYVSSKNSNNEKEVAIKNFSSENSNFSNFSNEIEMYKKSDDSERVSYRNSFSTNRSDKTFKDQMVNILEEYYKNFNKYKPKNA